MTLLADQYFKLFVVPAPDSVLKFAKVDFFQNFHKQRERDQQAALVVNVLPCFFVCSSRRYCDKKQLLFIC